MDGTDECLVISPETLAQPTVNSRSIVMLCTARVDVHAGDEAMKLRSWGATLAFSDSFLMRDFAS